MALVEISHTQGHVPVTVFRVRERVHLGNFSELENAVNDAYDKGVRNVVIDLSQSDTLTSIGLRALVIVHKILSKENSGKHLKIAGATTIVREIMQVTGISQFIDIFDTVEEAVASF